MFMLKPRSSNSINLVALTATTIASTLMASALHPNYAQAEVQKESAIATNESELVRSIGRDPMIIPATTANQSQTLPVSNNPSTDSEIIRAINSELGQSKLVKTSDRTKPNLNAQGVTSVSQLSDVKPTDWAFTALQSLVERYGCTAIPNSKW